MILNALVKYYDRLADEENSDIAPPGFSRQKVSFVVVLNPDGSLHDFHDNMQVSGVRSVARERIVPGYSYTNDVDPRPLWGNRSYLLGLPDTKDPKHNALWALRRFEAFRDWHVDREHKVNDQCFSAVCRFLKAWNPKEAFRFSQLTQITRNFGVFRVGLGVAECVHDRPNVRAFCLTQAGEEADVPKAPSLVSGEVQPIARKHDPWIKGVRGSKTSGAKVVSFDDEAFCSYGKLKSYNAPVGIDEAHKYCEALDLLTGDSRRRIYLGGGKTEEARKRASTFVWWSERPTSFEDELVGLIGPGTAEDQQTVDRLSGFFKRLRGAIAGDCLEDADVPFYILGLSPNGPRLSVRFWLHGTVKEFAERLGHHVADLEIDGPADTPPLTLRRLVLETARPKNGGPDEENVSPLLAGAILRSVLAGTPYPTSLLAAVIQRIRAEGFADPEKRRDWRHAIYRRAAILKAFLIRNGRIQMDVYLNKTHKEKAYHCGRLLAVLAFAQEKALGTVNSGVIRRNFGSVMAMPGLMLGRLQKAAEVGHIPKLDGDLPVFVRDELKSINVALEDSIPAHLDLLSQGVFALGFYQQLQYLDFIGEQVSKRRRYRTAQGDWVRSKLEVRTANALAKLNLIYVYEAVAVLPSAGERWPDFCVRGNNEGDDLYIEVLGMDTPEYNDRWELKRNAYEEFGATESGGRRGRLIVLDFRKSPFDELVLANALRARVTHSAETTQEETERN
ncbi:MAG: type I-C CRISPR-associated protein Cas8c/Csd1 [Planctomycetota bacterium]